MSPSVVAADRLVSLSSRQVCAVLGVTYRQLDYAAHSVRQLRGRPTMTDGSGSRRRWDLDTVRRLMIAARLAEASARGDYAASQWITAVRATMAGPRPADSGFAVLTPDGSVSYHQTLTADQIPVGPLGTVIRYELDLISIRAVVRAA